MNGSASQMIAEIKAAINNGTLSCAEMKRRLIATLNDELSQTQREANLPLVEACQSLLWEIHMQEENGTTSEGGKAKTTETNLDQRMLHSLASTQAKLIKRQRRNEIRKHALRIAVAAAATLALLFVAEVLFHREWLEGQSTQNEQDYVVQGNVVEPGVVQSGAADTEGELKEIKSTDFEEAISILSFRPPMPTWLPQGWEPVRYRSAIMDGTEWFVVSYEKLHSEKLLRYEVRHSHDVNFASSFHAEQNQNGVKMPLDNGLIVYFSANLELPTCVWIQNDMASNINGPLSQDEILQMIKSIKGE